MRIDFKTILTSAVCVAGAYATPALAEAKVYHAGTFSCGGHLHMAELVSSGGSTTIYYSTSVNSSTIFDTTERAEGNTKLLLDRNGNVIFSMVANADGYQVEWVNGAPRRDCAPFAMKQVESAKDRLEKAFAIFETEKPSIDDAIAAQAAKDSAPLFHTLPQLDQQDYYSRYTMGESDFWKNYRTAVLEEFSTAPIDTDADVVALRTKLEKTLTEPLRSTLREDYRGFLKVLQAASDRLADAGSTDPVYAPTCDRFDLLSRAQRGSYNFEDLEYIVGVSFDYWSRDLAEKVLDAARTCEKPHFVDRLASEWGGIVVQQESVQTYRAERDRLLALPATIETLKETNNLQPERENLKDGQRRQNNDRFFGASLDVRRADIVKAAVTDLQTAAAGYRFGDSDASSKVDDICDTLRGLSGFDEETRQFYRGACESARAQIVKVQVDEGTRNIKAAFASAKPLDPSADAARQLCSSLSTGEYGYDAFDALTTVCRSEAEQLEVAEADLKCTNAVSASRASDDVLKKTMHVEGSADRKMAIRDLVCEMGKLDLNVTLETSGMLMWSKTNMNIVYGDSDKDGDRVAFELVSSETGADFGAGEWIHKPENYRGPKVEKLLGCMMRISTDCHE